MEEEESEEEEAAMEGRKRKRQSKVKTILSESMSKKKPMTAITRPAGRKSRRMGSSWRIKGNNSRKMFLVATITKEISEKNYCLLPNFSLNPEL